MISLEKVIRNARKWQKIVAVRIKRISYSRITGKMNVDDNNPSFVAEKGHWKRFVVPLAYLGNEIFHKLFKMSEEEFGISSDRPITLPGDSEYMDYIFSLIQRGEAKDLEKVLTIPLPHDSTAQYQLHQIMNMLVRHARLRNFA